MGDLVAFARRCAEELGQTVYVCGLDGDYRREKFGGVLDLIPLCDTVTRLRGTCAECGGESLFSRRVEASEEVVRVGGEERVRAGVSGVLRRGGRAGREGRRRRGDRRGDACDAMQSGFAIRFFGFHRGLARGARAF